MNATIGHRCRRRRLRINRGAVKFGSAVIPDAYPTAAAAQFGSGDQKIPRQFVGGRGGAGGVFERHSTGVEDNVAVVEQIEKVTRHSRDTI